MIDCKGQELSGRMMYKRRKEEEKKEKEEKAADEGKKLGREGGAPGSQCGHVQRMR